MTLEKLHGGSEIKIRMGAIDYTCLTELYPFLGSKWKYSRTEL
jgi:hypothetical protein